MRVPLLALLAAMALALAGCALLRGPEAEPPDTAPEAEEVRGPGSELERLLDYFQRVKKLVGAELGKEHNNVRLAFTRTRSDFDRVRLAIVLSLPNTGFSDEARALDLLEPMARNQNSTLHGLAFLMSTLVQEQRRLGNSLQGMQQKLDALKSMERSLIEREQAGSKRR